jgi:hypothetical protein
MLIFITTTNFYADSCADKPAGDSNGYSNGGHKSPVVIGCRNGNKSHSFNRSLVITFIVLCVLFNFLSALHE